MNVIKQKIKTLTPKEYFSLIAIVTALFLAFLYFSPKIFSDYTLTVLGNIYIFIILAISYNLINGVTGQFSLEPNGFVAIGAYVTAILMLSPELKSEIYMLTNPLPFIKEAYIPIPFLALIISGVVGSLVALTLAFPVFRVRGDYLAIVTLGFGFIIRIFLINTPSVSNGSMGLDSIPGFASYFLIGVVALISIILVYNIVYSRYGRAMKSVRDDEDAALAMGINTFKIKTMAFMTSAFFEGVGGGLLASSIGSISPDQFTFMLTFQLLIIIVLGGLGSMSGAIFATFLFIGGMEILRPLDDASWQLGPIHGIPGLRMVVFSLILLLLMLFARRGIFGDKEIWDIIKIRRNNG
ncbi:branched-chain amino acid ABC transporter permease [Caminibacter mediatlanticus TB-2]|uniref:Branched-chain amino acid ABC transporter permease n=1 Tax=Caminibacter mediatlanticus TB-2 TaxID=391592 RepID=A0ABX5V631_9BACT|nr:branched-chain amino acid ABC transporter permease [Caminibacter mediatlanticus]QCT93733.1 branched-chain amino acid ABC transporter permease [Caminibacter mediatlanticus TB-2]